MRAIVVRALGGPEVLALATAAMPEPGPGEVLVRVEAIGVNFTETERRRGTYEPPPLPWIPGNEAAGVVERLGPAVEEHWLGRRVAFWAPRTSGAYAEYTVAPAAWLFPLLDALEFPVGAALPAQGLTAYGLAHYATTLEPGQSALVHAAAGGVGALLVQLLRRRGVRVFGTASTAAKRALVREAGAEPLGYDGDMAEAYGPPPAATASMPCSIPSDVATQAGSLAALGLYGHLVFFGESSGSPVPIHPDELYGRNLRVSSFWLAADAPDRWQTARRELQEWVVSGDLRVSVGMMLPLVEAAEAHRQLEGRRTHGKVILLPTPAVTLQRE